MDSLEGNNGRDEMINRRDFLKALGVIAAASQAPALLAYNNQPTPLANHNLIERGVYINDQWIGNLLSFNEQGANTGTVEMVIDECSGGRQWLSKQVNGKLLVDAAVVFDDTVFRFNAFVHACTYNTGIDIRETISMDIAPSGMITICDR